MAAKKRQDAEKLKAVRMNESGKLSTSASSARSGVVRDAFSGAFLDTTPVKKARAKSGKAIGGRHSLPPEGRVFKATIDSAGRILVPAKVRRALDLEPGTGVNLELNGDVIEIRSLDDAIRDAKALVRRFVPKKKRLVDELIAERRADAKRE